jgi:anti-anti-sigma factor
MFPYSKVLLHQTITRLLCHKGVARPSVTTTILSTENEDGTTRVAVRIPVLDARNAARFLDELSGLLLPGRCIIVSFEKVRHVDSAAIGAIITAAKRAAARGAEIKLCAIQAPVRRVFELVGLHKVVDVLNSCEESAAAFAAAGSSSIF